MDTYMHSIHPPKIVQIGWGYHIYFRVWKKSAITFVEGCIEAKKDQSGSKWSYLTKELAFMWIKILCMAEYILWRIFTTKSIFDVANLLKKITVKDVPNEYLWASQHSRLFISYVLEHGQHSIWGRRAPFLPVDGARDLKRSLARARKRGSF